ncbi:MAG: ribonuclease HII [Saprospiraceae bacterium]|nr:ribonuclease HII [Saprospiraceae bacterium]
MNLLSYYKKNICEAGCDEAGRGSLAGPVVAAAVILDLSSPIVGLNDSKKLSVESRNKLRLLIEKSALSFGVAFIDHSIIDRINILQASLLAMSQAIEKLDTVPEHVIVDGNRRIPNLKLAQTTIVKGDARYQSIAAASILAKTYRDEYMELIHQKYPQYHWNQNKGYASLYHRSQIRMIGISPYHRKSFHLKEMKNQLFD